MKITFLGTSHGVPSQSRYCSSLLLEVGDNAYLIDGGAPVADILIKKGYDFAKIKAIFTSHSHSDHTCGMLLFISLCNWHSKTANMDIFLTEQVLCDAVENLLLATDKNGFDKDRLKLKLTLEGEIYKDDFLKVTAVPTKHMEPYPSFALVFEAEGKRFIYTGDLHGRDACDFPKIALDEPSDLIISESAHFSVEVILEKLLSCPTKGIAITHIYNPNPEYVFNTIEKTAKDLKIPLLAPNDGYEYEF